MARNSVSAVQTHVSLAAVGSHFTMWCRLAELISRDCNQALSAVVRQLERGISEPEFVDSVMRPKRMVRSCALKPG